MLPIYNQHTRSILIFSYSKGEITMAGASVATYILHVTPQFSLLTVMFIVFVGCHHSISFLSWTVPDWGSTFPRYDSYDADPAALPSSL